MSTRIFANRLGILTVAVLAFFTLAGVSANGAVLLWDHNADGTVSDGTGTWLNANQWLDGATPATWNNTTPDSAIIGSGGAGGTITLGTVTAGSVLLDNFTGTYTLSSGSLDQSGGITIGANAGNVTIHTAVSGTGGITINGPSLVNLRGGGNNTFTGDLIVRGGGEALDDDFVNIGAGNLTLDGGAYVNYWADTLTRTLGSGAGQVQLPGGASGFSGQGSSGLTIRLNNNANSEVVWGSTHFNPSTLVLQTPWANTNGKLTWQNPIDLNGADRTIAVNKDHGNGGGFFNDGFAQVTGPIRNNDTGSPAGLVKEGPGRLILDAANTYDGGTTVNGGILEYARAAAVPSTGSVTFNNGTELWVRVGGANQFTAAASGAGSLGGLLSGINFSGAVNLALRPNSSPNYLGSIPSGITDLWIFGGSMTLSGTGAYTGSTIIGQRGGSAITVTLGSSTALPIGTPVTVDSSNRSYLNLNGYDATIGLLKLGSNNGGNQGTVTDTAGGGVLTITNGILLDGHNDGAGLVSVTTLDLNGTTQTFSINNNRALSKLTISSVIRNGGVTIAGGGNISEIVFSGANIYAGPTLVSAGVLRLDNLLALQNSPLDTSGAGTVNLIAGAGAYTLGGLNGSKNLSAVITGNPANLTTLVLNPGVGVTTTYSGIIDNRSTDMNLTKTGLGTQVLSGAHTYTGATVVDAGTLLINGSTTAGSAVTVASGATLGGTGTIGGTVANSGTIAPGASIGTLSVVNDLTWNSDNTLAGMLYELSDVDNTSDLLDISGVFTKGTGSDFLFDFVGGKAGETYTLVQFDSTTFSQSDFRVSSGIAGTFSLGSNILQFTAVPEPGAFALASLALLCLLGLRRRK